jgi:WD40 repeat protein
MISIATTLDSQYTFVGCKKNLKQYRVDDHELLKEYPLNYDIGSVVTTFDGKHAFVGLLDGFLQQICLDSKKVIKKYGKIHERGIHSMAVSRDNSFLITGGGDKRILKISIPKQKVVKHFAKIMNYPIVGIQLAPSDESLFVYDHACYLKLIKLTDGTTVHDFGRVHNGGVYGYQQSLVTRDGKHLFTSSGDGDLKQWSVRDRAPERVFGGLTHSIRSMCD